MQTNYANFLLIIMADKRDIYVLNNKLLICYKSLQENKKIVLTQQQAETVIWMVFRPGWHTSFR
jgi:hypothetical protein